MLHEGDSAIEKNPGLIQWKYYCAQFAISDELQPQNRPFIRLKLNMGELW